MLARLADFEAALGRSVPLPTRIPRRWGWVVAHAERIEGDSFVLELEVAPRVPLSPTGTITLHYQRRSDHAGEAVWPPGLLHRATAVDGDLAMRCDITRIDPRAFPDFLDGLAPVSWVVEASPPPVPRPLTRGGTIYARSDPATGPRHDDDRNSLPRLVQNIEGLTCIELPSLVSWPARLGVLASTRFTTFGVDTNFGGQVHEVGMELCFESRDPLPVVLGLRLSNRPDATGLAVGGWRVAVAATSNSYQRVPEEELLAALSVSMT